MTEQDINDWNRIAATYVQGVGTNDDRIYQQIKDILWESLGNVQGQYILDVGCGSGWLSRLLQSAGAYVTGIDGSATLLHMARVAAPDVVFLEYNLAQGLPPLNHSFDRVVAHMVLMDIPNIHPLLAGIRSVLKPQGKFIFTMQHPCFFQCKSRRDDKTGELFRMVKGYLKPEVWRIESFGGHNHYHRSLTYYFDHLRAHQFAVTRLYEPEHIPSDGVPEAEQVFWRGIPVFILIEAIPI